MPRYSIEPIKRNYVEGYEILKFVRNLSNKYGKQLLNNDTKTGLNALKTASKKVVHRQLK